MANLDHVNVLKQGVSTWNKWRLEEPTIMPDLSGVDFCTFEDKWKIDCQNRPNIVSCAYLREANFSKADLSGTILRSASLVQTNLERTNLVGADLRDANLSECKLGGTVLGATNLTRTMNLETCVHQGPSIIDFDTIELSWPVPRLFLRNCGMKDTLIEKLSALVNDQSKYYSCFISYSEEDEGFAKKLYFDLKERGVQCWFAPEDIKIGDDIWDTVDRAIMFRDKVVPILSTNSLESAWVEDEVKKAFAKERDSKEHILLPIRVDDTVMISTNPWATKIRDNRDIGNFVNWKNPVDYKSALERLLNALSTT